METRLWSKLHPYPSLPVRLSSSFNLFPKCAPAANRATNSEFATASHNLYQHRALQNVSKNFDYSSLAGSLHSPLSVSFNKKTHVFIP